MNIIVSTHGGFCYGVRRAYDMVKDVLQKEHKQIYIIGELIHNSFVVHELDELGIKRISNLNDIPDDAGEKVFDSGRLEAPIPEL